MKDKFHNRTRTTDSIPKKLISQRKFHYLPLYAILKISRLANEGMNNSGSYHFADHIYANKSSGKYVIGKFVDWTVLRLPSARDFRQRYIHAKKIIEDISTTKPKQKILIAPAGLAREAFELQNLIGDKRHVVHAMDLDTDLVRTQNKLAKTRKARIVYSQGDVLQPKHYPGNNYDLIICMGLTEFLDDIHVQKVFEIFRTKLSKNGILFTSSTNIHKFSDKLLRNIADLHTNYRSSSELHDLLSVSGYNIETTYRTKNGLQTIVRAKKK